MVLTVLCAVLTVVRTDIRTAIHTDLAGLRTDICTGVARIAGLITTLPTTRDALSIALPVLTRRAGGHSGSAVAVEPAE
jgi:hypothetical protein